jgi:hypothetical protein
MGQLNRLAFLKKGVPAAKGTLALSGMAAAAELDEGTSRRAFLRGTAGAAAGAAVVIATPKVAAVALEQPGAGVPVEPKGLVTTPSGRPPREPITAYVRDAERGEVTVLSGQQETTYTDKALVKRMLDAAR